jgi:peptidoglycan/xylan/chitin deacetylase (PgdA/CDA1 family)
MLNGAVRDAALRAGGLRLMQEIGRSGVRILLYHRFPSSARQVLEAQCAHLKKYYNVVSLTQVGAWLRGEERLAPNSLAVTVDDGYQDFYSTAYPVFAAHGIPVTIFLATDFLDRKCWLWVDRVEYAFQTTRLHRVELELCGEHNVFSLGSPEQRMAAIKVTKSAAKKMTNEAKLALVVEDLPELLEVTVPAEPPEDSAPLSWGEVREMSVDRIDFGAHTKTHPILSSVSSRSEVTEEILGSKQRIEEELQKPVLHFSYPNGTWPDLTSNTVEIVRHGDFDTAVTAQGGVNFRHADPFLLRRNTVESHTPELLFGRYATGFRRE